MGAKPQITILCSTANEGAFVDTAGWVACADAVDLANQRAAVARDVVAGGRRRAGDYRLRRG